MIFVSDNAFKYLKKEYKKYYVTTFLMFVGICTVSAIVREHEEKINNLTKKVEELSQKGD